jgi:hypothetical protein
MTGTMNFRWRGPSTMIRVRAAVGATLEEAGSTGKQVWNVVVPVETGKLKRSWFRRIEMRGLGTMVLVFGARIRYAIYVELGTGRMRPRAPIRTVAGELAPLILPILRRKLQRR